MKHDELEPAREPLARQSPAVESIGRRELLGFGAGAAGLASIAAAGAANFACSAANVTRGKRSSDERRAELDALFGDLSDQSKSVAPISADERAARRKRAGRILAQNGVDALLVEGGATFNYLAGITWGQSERLFALVVLADGSHFWLSPAFEAEKAKQKLAADPLLGSDIVVWQEHEYAFPPLASELRRRKVERIVVDPAARYFVADRLADAFGRDKVAIASKVVRELRGVKDAHELAILRRANELTQQGVIAASERIHVGMTGAEIGELVQFAQKKLGLTDTWDLSLIGAMAALPHGDNRSAVLEKDRFLLTDTGGDLHGYHSDITRTWCPSGKPGETELRAWDTVRDAQQRAFDAIRPGVVCSTIDRIARETIERAGFGSGYTALTHRLGHGIGLEGHEDPYFDGGSEVVLASGMCLSDEPGIYVLGAYGIRLEDVVACTDNGGEHFGAWQKGPLSPRGG